MIKENKIVDALHEIKHKNNDISINYILENMEILLDKIKENHIDQDRLNEFIDDCGNRAHKSSHNYYQFITILRERNINIDKLKILIIY